MTMSHLVNKIDYFTVPGRWGGGGGRGRLSSDFKWRGWLLCTTLMPNFCCTLLGCTLRLRYAGTTMNLQIVWIPKKSLLKSSCTPKKYLTNYFPNRKKSQNRKFQPPKNPFCHCHFKSGVTLLGHCWTAKITM